MKKIVFLSLLAVCVSFSACSETKTEIRTEPETDGWYCEELLHNTFSDTPYITDVSYTLEHLNPMKAYPLNLTDDYILTGFFLQDVSLAPEHAVSWSSEDLKNKPYAEAVYNDSWYFDLDHPAEYISLPDDLMPDFIRITYSPCGNIAVNERESVIISFSYQNAEKTFASDAMAFTWFNAPDTTGGTWNWNDTSGAG